MTPAEIKQAWRKLGLTLEQMATMLGYQGSQIKSQMHRIEIDGRPLREPQRRLIEAYLAGYRPPDWPEPATPRKLNQ